MTRAPHVVIGPSLYRHACTQCHEDTLHNARGCIRCGRSPWTKPIKLAGNARKMLTTGMKSRNW